MSLARCFAFSHTLDERHPSPPRAPEHHRCSVLAGEVPSEPSIRERLRQQRKVTVTLKLSFLRPQLAAQLIQKKCSFVYQRCLLKKSVALALASATVEGESRHQQLPKPQDSGMKHMLGREGLTGFGISQLLQWLQG